MNKLSSFIEKKCPWHNLQLTGPDLSCEKCGVWVEERVIGVLEDRKFDYRPLASILPGSALPVIIEDNLQVLKEYYDEKNKSKTA